MEILVGKLLAETIYRGNGGAQKQVYNHRAINMTHLLEKLVIQNEMFVYISIYVLKLLVRNYVKLFVSFKHFYFQV